MVAAIKIISMNPAFFSLAFFVIISLGAFSSVSFLGQKCSFRVRARTIHKYIFTTTTRELMIYLRAASSKCVNATPRLQSVFYMRL